MAQEINLYQPLFHKQQVPLGGRSIGKILLMLVTGILLVYGYEQILLVSAQSNLSRLRREEVALTRHLATLTEIAHLHRKSPLLVGRLDHLKVLLREKETALTLLKEPRYGNLRGFSGELITLSKAVPPGLWFDGIDIREGGQSLTLQGHALAATLVPRYFARLLKTHLTLSFESLQIRRASHDAPYLDFRASTTQTVGKRKSP
jgi:Tfp pilus assembly protein PilN